MADEKEGGVMGDRLEYWLSSEEYCIIQSLIDSATKSCNEAIEAADAIGDDESAALAAGQLGKYIELRSSLSDQRRDLLDERR